MGTGESILCTAPPSSTWNPLEILQKDLTAPTLLCAITLNELQSIIQCLVLSLWQGASIPQIVEDLALCRILGRGKIVDNISQIPKGWS